jgi:hypothetical protein
MNRLYFNIIKFINLKIRPNHNHFKSVVFDKLCHCSLDRLFFVETIEKCRSCEIHVSKIKMFTIRPIELLEYILNSLHCYQKDELKLVIFSLVSLAST